MAAKQGVIKAEVDREIENDFSAWAEREGRSKQRHASILLRKLTSLKRSHPDELARLGLMDRLAVIG
jgi:hypothetical protein